MLENLRRKSLSDNYIDPINKIHIEKGHAIYLDSFSIAEHKQKLAKKKVDKSFPSTFDGVSKEFRLLSHTLGDVKFNMICCPSGKFIMGHNDEEYNQPRPEIIERSFLLGETEVTQELYQAVMGSNPSKSKKPQKPVENLSWYDTISFCNELSRLKDLDKCYILTDISMIDELGYVQKRIMSAKVTCDFSKNGYRLPTEKEWEYAAKAGTQNKYAGTDNEKDLEEYAWFGKDSLTELTKPVKTKKPNEWGFYDMSGNVYEWCWDKYYSDTLEPSADRVSRGGSWSSKASILCSASRQRNPLDVRRSRGFRVCRSIVK